MAKVKIKVEDQDAWEGADQDSGDFELLPKGYYQAECVEVNPGFSKTDGEEDKKKPRLELVFEPKAKKDGTPLEGNFGKLWEYVSFSKDSAWKRAEMLWAFSLVDKKGVSEIDIETDEMVGKTVLISIKHEKDRQNEGEIRARIRKMLRVTDSDAEAAFGDGDGDGGVEFGGGDESNPFGGDEGADETQADYYTRAALEEVEDLKELGEAAKEFDLDPASFIVRNKAKKVDVAKTKAAVIDAILEAQGVGDNGGEDAPADEAGDEDSPF